MKAMSQRASVFKDNSPGYVPIRVRQSKVMGHVSSNPEYMYKERSLVLDKSNLKTKNRIKLIAQLIKPPKRAKF